MNAVFVGHVCIDHNSGEGAAYTNWGSALMHMARYFRDQLDLDPALVTSYGKDFTAYADEFHMIPPQPDTGKTLVMENHTQNGRRRQRCLNAGTQDMKVSDEAAEAIATADIIIVAPLLPTYPASYLKDLLSRKQDKCLTVLLPQGYFRSVGRQGLVIPRSFSEADEIIPMFDLVIFSNEDCPDPEAEAQAWAAKTTAKIIMTQASRGASYITPGKITRIKTLAVPAAEITDSVGCGDVFSAAAAYSYFTNREILPAIRAGNAAARAKLVGASGAIDFRSI